MTPIEIFAGVVAMTIYFTFLAWAIIRITSPEPHVRRPAFSVLHEANYRAEMDSRIAKMENIIAKLEALHEASKSSHVTKLEKMEYGDYISLDLYAERESKAWPLSGTHPDRR